MNQAFMSRRFAGSPQRGLTLVELLVSLTIGLLVTVAAASVYLMARQGFTTNEDQSRTFETGRLVVDQISRNFRMAGAPMFDPADLNLNTGGIRPFPVDAIVGVDGGPGGAPDSISIAYTNIDDYDAATMMGADCEGRQIGRNLVIVNTFFITAPRPSLACDGRPPVAPATGATAAGLADAVAGVASRIADQVVDMQILYGMATAASPGSASFYVEAPGVVPAGGWNFVRSAEICLDVASLEGRAITGATPGVNCLGEAFPADGRLHRLYRFTVNRRNETAGNIIPGPP